MVSEDLVAAAVAAQLTGLKLNTLYRFAEAGYVRMDVKSGGERCFSRRDLEKVFGVSAAAAKSEPVAIDRHSLAAAAATVSPAVSSEPMVPLEEPASGSAPVHQPAAARPAQPAVEVVQLPELTPAAAARRQELQLELIRLRSVVQLQERLLKQRDGEFLDLRQQRDWLRARIERLEDKGDREQLLLLNESRLISQLLTLEHKKSPVLLALEWLGAAPAPAAAAKTAEKLPAAPVGETGSDAAREQLRAAA